MEYDVRGSEITQEGLKRLLDYDPETGRFTWKVSPSNAVSAGSEAGAVKANGYRYINVCGQTQLANRLAWFYVHERWPNGYVRARNGDHADVRIENLYESTVSEANYDRRIGKNSTSGRVGVSFNARRQKWKAYARKDWKNVHLGWFATREEAVAARERAEASMAENRVNLSTEELERIAHHERLRQRQRAVWRALRESMGEAFPWKTLGAFAADVGDPPGVGYRLISKDEAKPLGPDNFEWLAPPSERFDLEIAAGRSAYRKEYNEPRRDHNRALDLKSRYDFKEGEDYEFHFKRQHGKCGICIRPERFTRNGLPRRLSVDHNHVTNVVRGLLCGACNSGMGYFEDNIDYLISAVEWAARHLPEPERVSAVKRALERLAKLLPEHPTHTTVSLRKESA
jgi:hypothetical protein